MVLFLLYPSPLAPERYFPLICTPPPSCVTFVVTMLIVCVMTPSEILTVIIILILSLRYWSLSLPNLPPDVKFYNGNALLGRANFGRSDRLGLRGPMWNSCSWPFSDKVLFMLSLISLIGVSCHFSHLLPLEIARNFADLCYLIWLSSHHPTN